MAFPPGIISVDCVHAFSFVFDTWCLVCNRVAFRPLEFKACQFNAIGCFTGVIVPDQCFSGSGCVGILS